MAEKNDLFQLLQGNRYPGRGIVLGRTATGRHEVVVYFIMGRSANSRNRIFSATADGIRTQAWDPAKLEDPSLIIYHPVRRWGGYTVVTNGDQTDTVQSALSSGGSFRSALDTRTFEPDPPNYTPRISGILYPGGAYELSILKALDGDSACCCRQYFHYASPLPGLGHLIHTYQGDGTPLPSFAGEPKPVALPDPTPSALADRVWSGLDRENRVSLFVAYIDLESGEADTVIRNQNQ